MSLDDDIEFSEWIYNRMKNVYGERENTDFMLRFKKVITNAKTQNLANNHLDIVYLKGIADGKEMVRKGLPSENPYPENIFLPIPKEDYKKINELLIKEMGYPIDRLSGNIGKELFEALIENLKES